MRAAEFFVALACLGVAVFVACGPRPQATQRRALNNFCVVIFNATNYPDKVLVRSAKEGVYRTSLEQEVPANGEALWLLGTDPPDLVVVESLALNLGWGPPDWKGGTVLRVRYPDGMHEMQAWPRLPE